MTRVTIGKKKSTKAINPETKVKLLHYAALEIGRLVLDGEYTLATLSEEVEGSAVITVADDSTPSSLVAAAKQIADRRAAKLLAMRTFLKDNQNEEALVLARELCGLREDKDETSDRSNPRIN